ncbi:MAG: hypothetical protein J6V25_12800 [Oscillospiraceae bacterium]|nr:hypothetical protein [Oscillospiraceae bacterium]
MKSMSLSTALQNCKKDSLLLFSTIAALCLFLSPSLASLVLTVVIFTAVIVATAFNVAKPVTTLVRSKKIGSILFATLIAYMGFNTFNTTWTPSSKVAALAGTLGMTTPMLLRIVGAVGCIVGLYAMYVLSCWVISLSVKLIQKRLPIQDKAEIQVNLKRNWYFPISAMAFFCLSATLTLGSIIGLLIVFVLMSTQISPIWAQCKNRGLVLRVLSLLTAIGVCFAGQSLFDPTWSVSSKIQSLEAILPIRIDIPGTIGAVGAVTAIPFVYFCLLLFWNSIEKILKESKIFYEFRTAEWIVYGVLLVVMLGYMAFSFTQSQAFYGTELSYDIIYTSDSPSLVKGNVYLALTHPENDLRQPLFAVFAAPFVGIPYLLSRLIGASATVQAILVNSVQLLMMFAANFMLAKMLKLDSVKRICFMVLTSCTYTQLLFVVMMEQYIVAYFWLIFCMYLIAEKQQPDRIALWGAGGTLLTSMILLPFMSARSPIRDFKAWLMDMVKSGLEFVALMLVFCRFDVIYNLMAKITQLSGLTGKSVSFTEKIYQYTEFIGSCLVAPIAGVSTTVVDHISWQLNPVSKISFAGILILILVVISAVWNRDKKSSLLAAGWVIFSVIMLLGLGWGTKENGLILYALYFGWAFLVLMFQLVEKIESKLNIKFLIPVVTMVAAIALLLINIPAIMEMLNFAITYYPA